MEKGKGWESVRIEEIRGILQLSHKAQRGAPCQT